MTSVPSNPTKHKPQRTCVACRQIKDKRELIRLVNTPENDVGIDTIGRKAGRGAYICRTIECWETSLKSNRLEHALRGHLSRDNREQL
ncbi:MAG: YlxR family protein, partial [Dehalococcoidales bacterium]|nr:YlxR family protein [Dehalococcoidales bacterium]